MPGATNQTKQGAALGTYLPFMLENYVQCLLQLGFTEGSRDPKNPTWYADLGTPVIGLWYGFRLHQGQWQYVSLCSYLGKFAEAVLHVYADRFNGRQKQQQPAVFATLYRTLPALQEALEKRYEFRKG